MVGEDERSVLQITLSAEYIWYQYNLPKLQHPNTEGCEATVHSRLYLRGVGTLGGKSFIGGVEPAQDEMDSINTNGRVRGVACVYRMRRAPSAGIIGRSGAYCLVYVFAFFPTSESKKKSTYMHSPPCMSSTIAHCKFFFLSSHL